MLGLWIGAGGGIGAVARFALGGWVTTWAYGGFPWATFLINILGSAALGYFSRSLALASAPPHIRAFVTVGLCGGFTTFSTFDLETLSLLHDGDYLLAVLYALGSVTACMAGVHLGIRLASRQVTGRAAWF